MIMRFPTTIPPPIIVGEDAPEILTVDELTVARPIARRNHPAFVQERIDKPHPDKRAQTIRRSVPRPKSIIEQDRRKMCRRIYNKPVMLDTRSGKDRRGERRRDKDIASHITIKA